MKNNFYNKISSLLKKKQTLVKVYSHPRSGTHFLEAFLAQNFYPDTNLFIPDVAWGHWSNRQIKKEGNPYGQLFGNHYFAKYNTDSSPKIYIVRDGRAVAYSVWKTPNFLHQDVSQQSFKEFLHTPLDWHGSPSHKVKTPKLTILEHWAEHVASWQALAAQTPQVLLVHYETLVNDPYAVYNAIRGKFFSELPLKEARDLKVIERPIGLLPNKGKPDTWKPYFDDDDNELYHELTANYNLENETDLKKNI
ncbi:hypothetical protein C1T31_13485 [Hanstruepera neustonica]|uniref:Sulfotransferase domain-containing protein n=1 Tax=Hanstruepera neustonica TaxID=1445657 RepID=A0A2K1DVQ0_9FLAO|nr:sulfotransferase domain-containing protein [Hanstruepera neustonica]PNQ72111.1 hypothetical protein C1T31_13485 [Hanstruepera neustonica]